MATIIDELKGRFRRGDMALQLLYINVAVFILLALASVLLLLFNRSMQMVYLWLEVPASVATLLRQPWTIITYMFLHQDLLHLLFNMLWLYSFGRLFLTLFSAKHLRGLYLLGGIAGGLLYVLAYNVFPYFQPMVRSSYMLGASASVLAIVGATAYRDPDRPLRLFLLGTIRLKWLALVVLALDLLMITSQNGGGHIAHLGGALAGLAFAASLSRGRDLTAWINAILDGIGGFFTPSLRVSQPKREKAKRSKMKVNASEGTKSRWWDKGRSKQKGTVDRDTSKAGSASRQSDYEYNAQRKARQEEIDRILDKIKASGYQNLTEEEKKTLFDASRR